nr:GIY-YIG nuclease family protein [uncultured Draconibacterium sp.]
MTNKDIIRINEKHNLFIIRSYGRDTSIIKIGYTDNLHNKLRTFLYNNPFLEVLFTCFKPDAKKIEKAFHKSHKSTFGSTWYDEILYSEMLVFIEDFQVKNVEPIDVPEPVFEYGKFYSNDEVEDNLADMYRSAGITKKVNTRQLKQYYEAEKMILIKDGRSISGFKVYQSKNQQVI